jgi:2-polyprenyl-3-methyl-5-hydroxy-6-metoxy-1,4-benzoquinol methylase
MSKIYADGDIYDTGAAWRQTCICTRLEQLTKLRVIHGSQGRPLRVLDFGAGSGFCVSFMRHRLSWDAYGFDLFSDPVFAKDRILNNWSAVQSRAPFDLIIASEVFEHFRAPATEIANLSEILSESNGSLFVTTGLFDPEIHGADWHYLAPQSGQHICFYAKRTMKEVARRFRAKMCTNLATNYEWFLQRNRPKKLLRSFYVKLACRTLSVGAKLGFVKKIE